MCVFAWREADLGARRQFLKQANGLDLGKLLAAYYVYYSELSARYKLIGFLRESPTPDVIHDKISVTDASVELDDLMRAPPCANFPFPLRTEAALTVFCFQKIQALAALDYRRLRVRVHSAQRFVSAKSLGAPPAVDVALPRSFLRQFHRLPCQCPARSTSCPRAGCGLAQ